VVGDVTSALGGVGGAAKKAEKTIKVVKKRSRQIGRCWSKYGKRRQEKQYYYCPFKG
jgi:hypothetical protein